MSQNVNLEAFESQLKVNWLAKIARNDTVEYQCPEDWWKSKEGTPLTFFLKKPPSWAYKLFRQHDAMEDAALFSAGFIVAHAHDYLGEPYFYDKEVDGNRIPVPLQIAQMEEWKYRIADLSDYDMILEIANGIAKALKENNAEVTPEDVKEPLTPETPA